MHVDDAGQGFDGGAGLRTDLEATGDRYLDLAGWKVEDDGDAAAAAGFTGNDALEIGQCACFADKNAKTRGGVCDDSVERLNLLDGQPQALLFAADIDGDDERLAGIEEAARLAQHFREQRHLVGAARIGHLHKGETVAAARGALFPADDDAGELEAVRRVGRETGWQVGPTDDSGA